MGDAWIGTQHARRVGHMLTGMEGSYTGPARWCSRCGARLRQQNHATLCAPCEDATAASYEPPPPPPPNDACAWCGRDCHLTYPQRYCSPTCRSCATRARDNVRKRAAYTRSKNTPETRTRNSLGQYQPVNHHEAAGTIDA